MTEVQQRNCGICGRPLEEGQEVGKQTIPAQGGSEAYDRFVHVACVEPAEDRGEEAAA